MSLFENNQANIFGSRDKIRADITNMTQDYMDLKDIDISKTKFLSYIVNVLSGLSSNLMYYNSNIYKEFFFTEARLPDSVINLSKWIDYQPTVAIPSTVDILFVIPISKLETDNINILIPDNYKVYAEDIPFTIDVNGSTNIKFNKSLISDEFDTFKRNHIKVNVLNKLSASVYDSNGKYYPVQINTTNNTLMFILPFKQKELLFESFTIPSELEFYQFYTKRLEFDENVQISNISIYIDETPNPDISLPSEYDEWVEASARYEIWNQAKGGIYTLSNTDKQYLWTTTYGNGEIFFGNGLVGAQPTRNSHVIVLLSSTLGTNGKIIPNSINKFDPLYYIGDNGYYNKLNFYASNVLASTDGKDMPTLNEIKAGAIAHNRSRNRLVSDTDYNDINIIIPNMPTAYSKPILKRSDLKINEIMLFNALRYQDSVGIEELVPTRNIKFQYPTDSTAQIFTDSTSSSSVGLYIPEGTSSFYDNMQLDKETIFPMVIDPISMTAKYEYVANQVYSEINFEGSSKVDYYSSLSIEAISFTKDTNNSFQFPAMSMIINVKTENDDIAGYHCVITTCWNDQKFDSRDGKVGIIYDQVLKGFILRFESILELEVGNISFDIDIYGIKDGDSEFYLLKQYSTNVTLRRQLDDIMFSTVKYETLETGESIYSIYDTPVILSEYLTQESLDIQHFNTHVLQKLMNNLYYSDKRMTTDFINTKFCDTCGKLTNMLYNKEKREVITRSLMEPPAVYDVRNINDVYLVNGGEGIDEFNNDWLTHIHEYARWNGSEWEFTKPNIGETIKINNIYNSIDEPEQNSKLVYTGKRWIYPIFDIPFKISLKVVPDRTVSASPQGIINSIKNNLLNHFIPKFGMDVNIDRSEIIEITRSTTGVKYAELIEPETDIRFKYDIDKLTHEELILYTPQLVQFTSSTITIKIGE